jgi:hypothetical protein
LCFEFDDHFPVEYGGARCELPRYAGRTGNGRQSDPSRRLTPFPRHDPPPLAKPGEAPAWLAPLLTVVDRD